MTEITKRWLESAKTDSGVAEHLLNNYHPKPLEIICYHCQLAAEKAIKALHFEIGFDGGLPKSHDLTFLLNQIKNRVSIGENIFDEADELSQYGVKIRYPDEMFVSEEIAKKSISQANDIIAFVENLVAELSEKK